MTSTAPVLVNRRVTAFAMGGQQRVAKEILDRLTGAESIAPATPLAGARGHLWEQAVLPWRARGRVLWSPSATGPLLHRRQVVTIHDTAFLDVPHYFTPAFVRLYTALVPRLARRVAKVVTVSHYSRRQLAAACGMPESAIEVIGNGVASHFRPYPADTIAATRAALRLPDRYVLLQATADRRKNLAGALAAWREAASRVDPGLHLVVSGNLGRAQVFGDLDVALDAPRMLATGYVAEEHMGPLMAGAEFFLFPSLYEGFGLPVIEAMAAGTPVITGNETALPEVAGDAAILVKAADPAAVADAIVTMAADGALRESLRAKGFVRSKAYDWDDAARRYQALFDSLG